MRKLFVLMFALFATIGAASASDDAPIKFNELPSEAQQFVKKHFSTLKVSSVTKDKEVGGSEYKIVFTNGDHIEFDRKGKWNDIECDPEGVPSAIIPAAIIKMVKEKHPDQKIVSIDRDNLGYDVELGNSVDIKFNLKGKFIRYDD